MNPIEGYHAYLKELSDNKVFGTVTFDFYNGEIREVIQNLRWKTVEVNEIVQGKTKQRLVIRPKTVVKDASMSSV
jgi:hypothetical protein